MKIVIDEDLPRSLSAALRADSHEILDIRDYDLRGLPDERIFHFAQEHRAVLMSADLGFANTLTFPLGSHCGIVVLRFPSELDTAYVNRIVMNLITHLSDSDMPGNLVILSPRGIRIRGQKSSRP
jgi:predicted nuclease of predicted toxin-antitoxin system